MSILSFLLRKDQYLGPVRMVQCFVTPSKVVVGSNK